MVGVRFEKTGDGFVLRAACRSFADTVVKCGLAGVVCWVPFQLWSDLIRDFWSYEGLNFWAVAVFLGAWGAGAMYAAGQALVSLLGEVRVSRAGETGRIFTGIGPLGWTHTFLWRDYTRASLLETALASTGTRSSVARYVVLEGPGKPLKFARLMSNESRQLIVATLEREVFER